MEFEISQVEKLQDTERFRIKKTEIKVACVAGEISHTSGLFQMGWGGRRGSKTLNPGGRGTPV